MATRPTNVHHFMRAASARRSSVRVNPPPESGLVDTDEVLAVEGRPYSYRGGDPTIEHSPFLGARGTSVALVIRRGGKRHTVKALRSVPLNDIGVPGSATPACRELAPGLAYVAVPAIQTVSELRAAAAASADRGLILDIRGPIRIPHNEIVSRLITSPTPGPRLETPVRSVDRSAATSGWEPVIEPVRSQWQTVPVAVLIDNRTKSSGEDFCIYVKDRVTFVGERTAGVDGVVSFLRLRRSTVVFTGMTVRWPDGAVFSGVQPDIPCSAVPADLQSFPDTVTLTAQRFLETK